MLPSTWPKETMMLRLVSYQAVWLSGFPKVAGVKEKGLKK
jgi:hypothetical protein